MRNKLFLIFVIGLFVISSITAFEFDNVKNYDEKTKTVEIKNAFGIGKTISKIQLNTPLVYYVMRGQDRLVAEFTIENFEDYRNVLKEMDFYDMNDNLNDFERDFTYRYKDFYDEQEFNWVVLDKKSQFLKGNITVGIFTDVLPNEKVEWIPTLFGVKINEWAVWTEGLSAGLKVYYNFTNENSVYGSYDLTLDGTPTFDSGDMCVVGKCANLSEGNNLRTPSDNLFGMRTSTVKTLNFWVYPTAGNNYIFYYDGDDRWYTYLYVDGTVEWGNLAGGSTAYTSTFTIPQNTLTMLTLVQNGTDFIYYKNGTNTGEMSSLGSADGAAVLRIGDRSSGNDYTGYMDEMSIWNRTLTPSEISDLWNNGDGLTYEAGDTTKPTYSGAQTNTTVAGEIVTFAILYDDDTALNTNGEYIFSTNNTGTWTNESAVNFTSTPQWANVTTNLNSTTGLAIGYRWFADDNAGNVNNTDIYVVITTDVTPPVIIVQHPTNITYGTSTIWFNATASEDVSTWIIDYNGTNVTHTINISWTVEDGNHHAKFWASDASSNFGLNDTIYFSVDTSDTTPPYFITIPSNVSLNYGTDWAGVWFNASDETSFDAYAVNDTRFTINDTGYLLNSSDLFYGNYLLNVSINDTAGNTNCTVYHIEINQSVDSCQVYFNETSPLTYPDVFTVMTNCSSAYTLAVNGSSISNNSVQNSGVGAYNFSVIRTDNVNYTNIYDDEEFQITKAIPIIIMSNGTSMINNSGLVGYWKADGDAIDSSGNGNDGSFSGDANASVNGRYGNAFGFNGIDSYIGGDNASMNFSDTNQLTNSYWIKIDNIAQGDVLGFTYDWTQLVRFESNKKMHTHFHFFDIGDQFTPEIDLSSVDLTQWHFVTTAYNGTHVHEYFDGELKQVTNLSGQLRDLNSFKIGRIDNSGWEFYFNGSIDEVMIFNRALSSNEISMLYETSKVYTTSSDFNASVVNSEQSINLYKNLSLATANPDIDVLAYGSYYYTGNLSATQNYTSSSFLLPLTINQNTTSCQIYFNETSPLDVNEAFLVYTNCTSSYNLYRNGTLVNNNSQQIIPASAYNYSVIRNDNENYSNIYDDEQFIVNTITTSLSLAITPSNNEIYTTTTTAAGSNCPSQLSCNLYRDGVNLSNPDNILLGYGSYTYIYNTTGNENYTSDSTTDTLTVNQNTSSCQIYFNGSSPLAYPGIFTTMTNCTSDYTLTINGTAISNNSVQILGVSAYNYSVLRTDAVNYTTYFDDEEFRITIASGNGTLELNGTATNKTIYRTDIVLIEGTLDVGTGNIYIFINETLFDSGASPLSDSEVFNTLGYYEINLTYLGNENATAFVKYLYVNVIANPFAEIIIKYPLEEIYTSHITRINYTVVNYTNCWYNLNEGGGNVPVVCGTNITGISSVKDLNTWTVYVNNTDGVISSSSVTFRITLPYDYDDLTKKIIQILQALIIFAGIWIVMMTVKLVYEGEVTFGRLIIVLIQVSLGLIALLFLGPILIKYLISVIK